MMLGIETRLPEHLMHGPAAGETTSRESHAAELAYSMKTAHDKLRAQQLQLRTGDTPGGAILQSWTAGLAKDQAVLKRSEPQTTAQVHWA